MSDSSLRFDGKVVVVTGAGGGLGKAYALLFASRGASVVVNDLGGDIKGGGKSSRAADVVVDEIRQNNGKAVANYDSVENAENIIKTAIDNFGRLDILINNAGILRDRSFLKTTDEDWDLIHRIHLRSSFLLSRAAWPHMQKNKYGRIIMTSSAAGLYGNFGQSNYSSAKLGLLGLSNTLSLEGAKYNIQCNTIAPLARSRLTETVMPEELLENLKPDYVAPLVLFLCHDSCAETGAVFEVGGGWVGKLRWQKSSGKFFPITQKPFNAEDVRDNWEAITSFDNPIYHKAIGESTNYVINLIDELRSNGAGQTSPTSVTQSFSYNFRDAILYALSLNFSTVDNVKFLYENHPDFSVFPTYGVIVAQNNLFDSLRTIQLPKGVNLDLTRLLHGEQYLELYRPLATSDELTIKAELVDVLDKGSGASLILNVEAYNQKNEKVSLNQFVIFLVGSGNFGGKRDSDKAYKINSVKPTRTADRVVQEKTNVDQAALYRLNGDYNPLHIDPEFAAMGGFNKPILHGLCSFGLAVKHVLQTYCNSDVTCFKAVKARFAKPVLPGQTLQTSMWLEQEGGAYRVNFECKVVETDSVCISGAYVLLHRVLNNTSVPSAVTETKASSKSSETNFAAVQVFTELTDKLVNNPDIGKKINAVYVFVIKNGSEERSWTVDLRSNKIYEGQAKEGVKVECTITLADDDFVSLSKGKLNPQQAFMNGKLKVKGNIMLAQKLGNLFKENSKL